LLDVEVGQVLRRCTLTKKITEGRAKEALEDLADLPVIRYPHGPLLARAFAMRHHVTIYDAVYLALAEALEAPLLTRDVLLARAPCHRATVRVVGK
jgi:predicted nucleic acid-binding protein